MERVNEKLSQLAEMLNAMEQGKSSLKLQRGVRKCPNSQDMVKAELQNTPSNKSKRERNVTHLPRLKRRGFPNKTNNGSFNYVKEQGDVSQQGKV